MQLRVHHSTQYVYTDPVNYALQQVRLTPQSSASQKIMTWHIHLEGAERHVQFHDAHGNLVDLIEFSTGAEAVTVTVSGLVETTNTHGVIGAHKMMMPLWFFLRQTALTTPGQAVEALVAKARLADNGLDDVQRLHRLSERILEAVPYMIGQTISTTTAEEALRQASGVCQDHTHIFLSAARRLGYPARYVSGYLMMTDRIDQEASHAWAEAYLEGLGWVGFDVSNAISPDEKYIALARGLDYKDCAPTTGFLRGATAENLVVSIQVQQ